MAERSQAFGIDKELSKKLSDKYDPELEKEVLNWINQLINVEISTGSDNVHEHLKNGQTLLKLINEIYSRTSCLPEKAKQLKTPFKENTSKLPFKQMENIELFLNAADSYGVDKSNLFQTVDLFENRNMSQILILLSALGTECQRNNMDGPVCGPKPSASHRRNFTEEQLRSGQNVIGLQMGTNKCASQKGMSMGGARHVADIKTEEMSREGSGIIGLQMGSNKGANQSGMSFGGARHINDIKVGEMSKSGESEISLQYGTNKGANQSGMQMGNRRHINDNNQNS